MGETAYSSYKNTKYYFKNKLVWCRIRRRVLRMPALRGGSNRELNLIYKRVVFSRAPRITPELAGELLKIALDTSVGVIDADVEQLGSSGFLVKVALGQYGCDATLTLVRAHINLHYPWLKKLVVKGYSMKKAA